MAIENDVTSLGKTYRFLAAFFPVDSRRKGNCKRCGRCCRMTNCKLLEFDNNGNTLCPIHKIRPLQCRKYPRSKKELFTHPDCGYKFH